MTSSFMEGVIERRTAVRSETAPLFARAFLKKARGQMFIVTIIFLAGLVFTVQQLLLQPGYINAPSLQKTDYYAMNSVTRAISDAVQAHKNNCSLLETRLADVESFIESRSHSRGFSAEIKTAVKPLGSECDLGTPVDYVSAQVLIKGEKLDGSGQFCFKSSGEIQAAECA